MTTGAYEGMNAVRLTSATSTHKRFTTAAKSMAAGSYTCTYQVQGTGEIRNAFYDTTFSTYSPYTAVSTQTWQEVTYTFTLANNVVDTFELIFSVRNTSGDNLLVDDVVCTLD